MIIQVLKIKKIEGNMVYIRRIGNLFEYILIYRGKIYQHYMKVKPRFVLKFNEDELNAIVRVLLTAATKVLKELKKKKKYEKAF